jgi:hypothetical protein
VSNETARSCYMEKQPDIFTLSRNDPNSPGAYKLPSAHEPTFQGRIEAACLALAYQGNIGLTTRMALMYPSTDIDAGSCAKYGAIVISRLLTAAAGALHQPQIDQISQELAEYLTSNYECS